MNRLIKFCIYFLLFLNVSHLVLLVILPFGGATVFVNGIFAAVLRNNPKWMHSSQSMLLILNIGTSILYFGSILFCMLLPFAKQIEPGKKLIIMLLLTLLPFVLVYIMQCNSRGEMISY